MPCDRQTHAKIIHKRRLMSARIPKTFGSTAPSAEPNVKWFFFTNLLEIVGIQADVWKKIAENINTEYKEQQTPGSIRIRVALNRGGIKQKLGLTDLAALVEKEVKEVCTIVRTDTSVETPCAISKRYLQTLISNKSSYIQTFDNLIEENVLNNINDEEPHDENKVETIEGEYDNAQFIPELVPLIVKAMKLYPCWSGIMRTTFGYGDATVSSSRVECNFNQLKNKVFEADKLPIRVDDFTEKLLQYYNGDHLLLRDLQSLTTTPDLNNEKYIEQNISEDNNYQLPNHNQTVSGEDYCTDDNIIEKYSVVHKELVDRNYSSNEINSINYYPDTEMIEKSNELLDEHEIDKNDAKRIEPYEENENNTIKNKNHYSNVLFTM
ncbi:hypothetical protein ACI65C_009755 [Semiaphis heraclei]